MTDNNIGQTCPTCGKTDSEFCSNSFHLPNIGQKEEGMEHKPDLEATLDQYIFAHIGVSIGAHANTPMDKGECKVMLRQMHKDYVLPLQSEVKRLKEKEVRGDRMISDLEHEKSVFKSEVKIKEARIRELEEEKDSFAIGFAAWITFNSDGKSMAELLEMYKKTTLK